MINFVTKNFQISFNFDNTINLSVVAPKCVKNEILALKQDVLYDVKVTIHKNKRTKTQNSYMWELIGELANVNGMGNIEMYQHYIREYGQYEIIPIKNEAVSKFISNWVGHGLGWYAEELKESKINGYTNVVAYYGSSTYNTKEMARLLDGIIQDCEQLGIATYPYQNLINENEVK